MENKYNVNAIVSYLRQFSDDLPNLYEWNMKNEKEAFGKLINLEICNEDEIKQIEASKNSYEKGIKLKEIIHEKLKKLNASKNEKFKDLSLWIIKDWGGIKSGDDKKALRLIDIFLNDDNSFDRIASTSKIAAFKEPEKYIIYDSRVAYSLNWIILSQTESTQFFPMPDGRNSKLKAYDIDVLIRLKYIKYYRIKDRKELDNNKNFISGKDRKFYIDKKIAYSELNTLIKEIHKELWKNDKDKTKKLYYTEMLLFALADSEIFNDITKSVSISIEAS